ncbi:uncharacterized protein MONBRDRAFT_9640 [Monosiga brevicollis MX1]|uniref:GOLD domain-containing protein n=1 Tax=Monosiga brevicollis TaxID=81824 RepID=A9V3X9_MONBE|nr:uncharacterized protein MONBRDRAFT_9640 [Monosiga brevicollis MX1]EDQ87883.1 predicted protein [Monosiga brevicollis MX1]|eukprot:XP_001747416.1 hypothetical protein [Monosiga brevicollis MX1]
MAQWLAVVGLVVVLLGGHPSRGEADEQAFVFVDQAGHLHLNSSTVRGEQTRVYVNGHDLDAVFDQLAHLQAVVASQRALLDAAFPQLIKPQIYLIGGVVENNVTSDVQLFDGYNWTMGPSLPTPRAAAAAAVYGEYLYYLGGSPQAQSRVDVFNRFAWYEGPSLNIARAQLEAVTFRGRLYALGGYDNMHALSSVEVFKGSSWAEGPPMIIARHSFGAVVFQDRLYVVGGSNDTHFVSHLETFDGEAWSLVDREMPQAVRAFGLSVFQGLLYVVGGTNNTVFSGVWTFDGVDWAEAPALSQPRRALSCVVYEGELFAIGGAAIESVYNVEIFNGSAWRDGPLVLRGPRHTMAVSHALGSSFTVVLDAGEEQCYFEDVDASLKPKLLDMDFQVTSGGNRDVDFSVTAPNGQLMERGVRKREGGHESNIPAAGTWKFCFSNRFSTMTQKAIYFSLFVDYDNDDSLPSADASMHEMEESAKRVHRHLQTCQRLASHIGTRYHRQIETAEFKDQQVMMFSSLEIAVVVAVGALQVVVIRRFFNTESNKPAL